MVRIQSAILVAATLCATEVFAHPGHDAQLEARERADYFASVQPHKRSLASCADKIKARGDVAYARRAAHAERLRAKRHIKSKDSYLRVRDVDTVLGTSHKSNLTGITVDTDPSTLFSSNASCLLTPEVTEGPYYVTGELVRQDVSEDQEGVPLTVDIEIIDVNTCEPLPEVYLEWWHCNSTGVYSGIVANGNGNSDDKTNVNKTFHRGIQKSNSEGVVVFDSTFPGHYTGRATHVHLLAHLNSTLLSNKTISGGKVSHVGQIFFDQDLISQVETVAPYTANQQTLTLNTEDMILGQEAADVDPVVSYVLLGDSISDGVFAWISFGMDSSAAYNVSAAANIGKDGGVQNPNAGMPPGPPPSGGSGGPGGPRPTGTSTRNGTSPTASSTTTSGLAVFTGAAAPAVSISGSLLAALLFLI